MMYVLLSKSHANVENYSFSTEDSFFGNEEIVLVSFARSRRWYMACMRAMDGSTIDRPRKEESINPSNE